MNLKRSIFILLLLAVLIVPASKAAATDAPAGVEPKADAPVVTIIYFWGDG